MNRVLTSRQAFYAMQLFLEDYFRVTSSDSIGALLSCMQFLDDDQTVDPALWEDWCKIIGGHSITITQAFQAMSIFLGIYFQQTSSTNVKNMLNDIFIVIDDKLGKDRVWEKWMTSVDQVSG
jgi:hypothetical protein